MAYPPVGVGGFWNVLFIGDPVCPVTGKGLAVCLVSQRFFSPWEWLPFSSFVRQDLWV